MQQKINYRLGKSNFFKGAVIFLSILCTIPLFLILIYILKEGITKINWHFLVNLPKPVGETGGGIANALIGSLLVVFFAALIAIPFGIMGGIYLSENRKSRLANWTRLSVDVLQGTPSIVVGIVVYFWLVKPSKVFYPVSGIMALKGIAIAAIILISLYLNGKKISTFVYWVRGLLRVFAYVCWLLIGIIIAGVVYWWKAKYLSGFSALSGSVALAIMMLPIIIRSTEETLKLLPSSLKEAGLALGLPYQRVILRIIVPCGFSGVISGVILAVARIAGETAPLLFTAFGNPFFSTNILKPMQSLPLLIFNYATSPYDEWHDLAWGAALILLMWVLLLNIITKITTRKWKIQF